MTDWTITNAGTDIPWEQLSTGVVLEETMTDGDWSVVEMHTASVEVQNLGGIDRCELEIEAGGTVLIGRNATNRTSLLSALGGVLGGSTATLKSDAEEGTVTMSIGDERYDRTYFRSGAEVQVDGTPYTADETLVDTFVALLEDNPARRAVQRGDDLREVLMRPVDTDAIEAEIDALREALREHAEERERVERRRAELPALEERHREIGAAIDEIESELDDYRETVAEFEAEVDASEAEAELVEELDRRRQTLKEREEALEVAHAELDALEEDVEGIKEELDSVPDVETTDVKSVETDLADARERRRSIDETISSLTAVVEFNEDLLGEDLSLPGMSVAGDVIDQLAPSGEQEVLCWTCGSHVERVAIGDRLDALRGHVRELREEQAAIQEEIDDLEKRRRELVGAIDRRESLESRLSSTHDKTGERQQRVEDLTDEIETVREEIVELEGNAADAEALGESEILSTYERISELEYERGQLRKEFEAVESEIAEVEALPQPEKLDDRRVELQEELARNRDRIGDIEMAAVSAFNNRMDELLSLLEYENIGRVWIERKTSEGGNESTFDLQVVRESEAAGYEDVVENLSESEREVIGLVVALSGYLVHDVYETVPFMLLDSLEAIDAKRVAVLVDYFADLVPYLVMALLTEDAAVIGSSYERITADALN